MEYNPRQGQPYQCFECPHVVSCTSKSGILLLTLVDQGPRQCFLGAICILLGSCTSAFLDNIGRHLLYPRDMHNNGLQHILCAPRIARFLFGFCARHWPCVHQRHVFLPRARSKDWYLGSHLPTFPLPWTCLRQLHYQWHGRL